MAKTTTDPTKTVDPLSTAVGASQQPGQFDLSSLAKTREEVFKQARAPETNLDPIRNFINTQLTTGNVWADPDRKGKRQIIGQFESKTPELEQVGRAGLSDLQARISARDREVTQQEATAKSREKAVTGFVEGERASVDAANKRLVDFRTKGAELDEEATARKEEGLAHNQRVYDEFVQHIDGLIGDQEDVLPRQLQVASQAAMLSSRSLERQIKEQEGADWANSPTYQSWALSEQGKWQTTADRLVIASADTTQRMREISASGAAGIQSARVQTDSWNFQREQDAHQATRMANRQAELDFQSFESIKRASEFNAITQGYLPYLEAIDVAAIETAPLLATLLELQQTAEAAKPPKRGSGTAAGLNYGRSSQMWA